MEEPDGLIDIFSLSLQGRPELSLTCQYEIVKASFNPHNPNMVIGSTMSGYLLLWDIRAKKEPVSEMLSNMNRSQPIRKTCLAQNGHQYPVYCLGVTGYQNTHEIISISNDGKMCKWKPKVLADPHETHELVAPKHVIQPDENTGADQVPSATSSSADNKSSIYAHCMDFTEGDQEVFYVGAEDFNIYQCNIKSEQIVQRALRSHNAPVTSVHVHPGASMSERHSDMNELLLSSSMDWTVKIWSPNTKLSPLFTFESSQEYVYDAQWSPTHPSVFASCNVEGYVDVWNINNNKETPIVHKQVQEKSRPINCLRWSRDGRRLATGDSQGYVSILQVDNDLCTPKPDDFDKIAELVQVGA